MFWYNQVLFPPNCSKKPATFVAGFIINLNLKTSKAIFIFLNKLLCNPLAGVFHIERLGFSKTS